jgi:hypothetical protein
MRKGKSKARRFFEDAETIGLMGTDASTMSIPEILEVFVRGADGDKKVALDRIQEYLDKLSVYSDPEYVSRIRRVKLRLEESM